MSARAWMPFRQEIVVRSRCPGVEAEGRYTLSVQVNVYAPAAPYVSREPADAELLCLVNTTYVHALESGTRRWIFVAARNFARSPNVI